MEDLAILLLINCLQLVLIILLGFHIEGKFRELRDSGGKD